MYDFTYTNTGSFVFKEVNYTDYHCSTFPRGADHHYLMYMEKGSARITSQDTSIELKEKELLFIPRKTIYNTALYGSPDIKFYSFAFLNYPSNAVKRYKLQKIKFTERMKNYLYNLLLDTCSDCGVLGSFYFLLEEVFKSLEIVSSDDKNQQILKNAMNFMYTHPNCNVEDVAQFCNISEPGLYKLFNSSSETTPAKFKLKVKLESAVNYLVSTDIPIEEICDLCNFSSSSYFRKVFYKAYKTTPSAMRKESKNTHTM